MKLNFDDEKPVFLQIAEGMEDAILTGVFQEESQIPSTTELSVTYKINPATALKGINLLVDAGIGAVQGTNQVTFNLSNTFLFFVQLHVLLRLNVTWFVR